MSATGCLIEGCTFVGERFNWGYNDPPSADLARQNRHRGNRVRNCVFDWLPTKNDGFLSPRFGSKRPGFTEGWQVLYGVGHQDNALARRHPGWSNFRYEYSGLRAVESPAPGPLQGNGWTRFARDASALGGDAAAQGHGDYRPDAFSPLAGRGRAACTDADLFGAPRGDRFAAGAAEPLGIG